MKEWYPLRAADCPQEGSDAGDATEWMREQQLRRVQASRRRARQEFDAAKHWLPMNRARAQEHARAALAIGAQTYWLAELTELAEREHRTLHAMGKWTSTHFACPVKFENGQYVNSCPVWIADLRMGLSPGFRARKECSICSGDLAECAHRKGRLYWVRGAKSEAGNCRVCAAEACAHRDDRVYLTTVVGIIRHIDEVLEVSWVDVPSQPLARVTGRPMSTKDLSDHVGPGFVSGLHDVNCGRCQGPYPGLPVADASNWPRSN